MKFFPDTANLAEVKEAAAMGILAWVTTNPTLLTARAGATYAGAFVGRLDDIPAAGMDVIAQIKTIIDNQGLDTKVIVASICNPMHVTEAAMIGADTATIPFRVIEQLLTPVDR